MKLSRVGTFLGALAVAAPGAATAGGLFLPGAGAVSTSRAGAAVASADDGEALAMNPAGIAKAKGTTITVSAAMISYAMEFTRRGTYDQVDGESYPYEGMKYPTMKNDAKPPLGFGSFQPVPVIAIISDLGGRVEGLHVAAGLYAPNAYPFRDMCTKQGSGCKHWTQDNLFDDTSVAPPTTRYDIMYQEAAVLLPSVAASYRILPELDVGARFSLGFANLKSTTAIWGVPANVSEDIKKDGAFTVKAKDSLIPAWGLGVTYRPAPTIELGANYSSQIDIHGKGEATSANGPSVNLNGAPITIGPTEGEPRCAAGGSFTAQKACVEFSLPMTAEVGARYKLLGADGALKGDIELDAGWEHWSADRATNYRVVVDGQIYVNGVSTLDLKDNTVRHGLQDTYNVRLGGSYHLPVSANELILRGGVGFDTAAAKTGWLRSDIDGAARTTVTVGAGYRTKKLEVNIGGGVILEGSPSNAGTCNPTPAMYGCDGSGNNAPLDQRQGPDPINPIIVADQQLQNPVTQGDYTSHYVLLMLGVTTWF